MRITPSLYVLRYREPQVANKAEIYACITNDFPAPPLKRIGACPFNKDHDCSDCNNIRFVKVDSERTTSVLCTNFTLDDLSVAIVEYEPTEEVIKWCEEMNLRPRQLIIAYRDMILLELYISLQPAITNEKEIRTINQLAEEMTGIADLVENHLWEMVATGAILLEEYPK